ncbi:MAG: class I SAM-dependent methyltransferase [Candidatus Paceibacterota bacterium]|jgi:ubiquinone/menaquinone biosynthesis C-methylase UbiE
MKEFEFIEPEKPQGGASSSAKKGDAKIKDMLWTQPEIFEIYESVRKIYRPLNTKIVEETLKEYVNEKDERIVEVGSGIGEMSGIVPESIEKRMVHTERNPEFAAIQKEGGSEREVAAADVERLPFKDNSADVVTGYAMFDTLFNSEKSAEEIKRILKKDGKFIHFLDLGHNEDILIEDYKNQGKVIFPVPFTLDFGEQEDYMSHCYASKKEIKEALSKMDKKDPFYQVINEYIEDPGRLYFIWNMVDPSMLKKMVMRLNKEGVFIPPFDPTLYFRDKMDKIFEDLDFKVLENRIASKKERVKRDERFASEPEYYNDFKNRVGRIYKREKDLPTDEVDVEALVHVFVAQKK